MQKVPSTVTDEVAETLYIPLYMRALETGQSNAIVSDPKACELVEKIDYDFSKFKSGKRSAIGVAIRVRHFDQKVQEFILTHRKPVVVLVGCGLDTRYHRITDRRNALFYELDLPEVIALRNSLLPTTPDDIALGASILETNWMDMLKSRHPDGDFIFVVEGVLMYFEETVVRQFFLALTGRFSGARIHFDVVNKWMSRNAHIHDTVRHTRATFKFGCDDDRTLESWSPRMKYVSTLLFKDVPEWRRLLLSGLVMKLIPRFRYAGRMLEYRIE